MDTFLTGDRVRTLFHGETDLGEGTVVELFGPTYRVRLDITGGVFNFYPHELARLRAAAAATPDVESTAGVPATPVVSGPQVQEFAPRDHVGGG